MPPKSLQELLAKKAAAAAAAADSLAEDVPPPLAEPSGSSRAATSSPPAEGKEVQFDLEASLTDGSSLLIYAGDEAAMRGVGAEEAEQEMPSSSRPIFDDEVDLMALFGNSASNGFGRAGLESSASAGERLFDLEAQNAQLMQALSEAQDERRHVQDRGGETERQIQQLQQSFEYERQQLRSEAEGMRGADADGEHSRRVLQEQAEELQMSFNACLADKNALETRVEEGREMVAAGRHELADARSELNRMRMEGGRTHSELEALKAECADLRQEMATLQRERDTGRGAQEQQLQALGSEKQWCEQQLQHLRQEAIDRSSTQARMNADIANLTAENAALRTQCLESEGAVNQLRQVQFQHSVLQRENQFMVATQQQLQQQLQQQQMQLINSARNTGSQAVVAPMPPLPTFNASAYSAPYEQYSAPVASSSYARAAPKPTYSLADLAGDSVSYRTSEPVKSLASLVGASRNNKYTQPAIGSPPTRNGNVGSSLSSLLQNRGGGGAYPGAPTNTMSSSPFANDLTSAQINHTFDEMERRLTLMMSEKTGLQEEGERLHGRGLKTLKERTRLQAVELRLGELSRDIGEVRKDLTAKPN
ncbi:hypothetical protein B484DRAFT_455642 [Ochromonadaceae sp. CCMP2298]|nr:hypothetical protein B484DRAFT_455642 [Ochromonadaceae sp. CCMP2298]